MMKENIHNVQWCESIKDRAVTDSASVHIENLKNLPETIRTNDKLAMLLYVN